MSRISLNYVCQKCGFVSLKWMGCCEGCGSWNTFVEEPESQGKSRKKGGSLLHFADLEDKKTPPQQRMVSHMEEFNRVLGGGIVPGSVILLGGDPGIGKSTLLLQIAANLSKNFPSIYISGEEGIDQVRLRAKRLHVQGLPLKFTATTSTTDILRSIESHQFALAIIDSIQTMNTSHTDALPGTIGQLRASSHELIQMAKKNGIAVILVGHVTKEGVLAGPRLLEHMVDTVLYFEGDRGHPFRILRAQKNRFGPTDEIGVFDMYEKGLREVENPSSLFLSDHREPVIGSAIFAGIEGSRPLLAEIQGLLSPSYLPSPRRSLVGWDSNRLAMILAILETRAGMNLSQKDVYLNVLGGLKLDEPAADLAAAAALVSCILNKPLPSHSVFFGELSLSGEVRNVSRLEARLKESQKLGFQNAIIPQGFSQKNLNLTIKTKPLAHIRELISFIKDY